MLCRSVEPGTTGGVSRSLRIKMIACQQADKKCPELLSGTGSLRASSLHMLAPAGLIRGDGAAEAEVLGERARRFGTAPRDLDSAWQAEPRRAARHPGLSVGRAWGGRIE